MTENRSVFPWGRRNRGRKGGLQGKGKSAGGIRHVHYIHCADSMLIVVVYFNYVYFVAYQLYFSEAVYKKSPWGPFSVKSFHPNRSIKISLLQDTMTPFLPNSIALSLT